MTWITHQNKNRSRSNPIIKKSWRDAAENYSAIFALYWVLRALHAARSTKYNMQRIRSWHRLSTPLWTVIHYRMRRSTYQYDKPNRLSTFNTTPATFSARTTSILPVPFLTALPFPFIFAVPSLHTQRTPFLVQYCSKNKKGQNGKKVRFDIFSLNLHCFVIKYMPTQCTSACLRPKWR